MAEDDKDKGKLPGNHGQFGAGEATEDYQPLEKNPAADKPVPEVQRQTNAGERS